MDKKQKRIRIIVGIVALFFVLVIVSGIVTSNKQNEKFTTNRENVLSDLKSAINRKDLKACERIKDEYGLVDDYQLKNLFDKYELLKDERRKADKLASAQAAEDSMTVNIGEPFRYKVLEVLVKKMQMTDKVGGVILNESSQPDITYLCVDYSYKNISKSPTHEQPELVVISPDGAEYSPDVSAGALYAGASEDYDEELISELNPQVYSNGVEVFKVPSSIRNDRGWKLQVTIETGAFSGGRTIYLKIN